jgi:hypothetical protein
LQTVQIDIELVIAVLAGLHNGAPALLRIASLALNITTVVMRAFINLLPFLRFSAFKLSPYGPKRRLPRDSNKSLELGAKQKCRAHAENVVDDLQPTLFPPPRPRDRRF